MGRTQQDPDALNPDLAAEYAAALLRSLPVTPPRPPVVNREHPALAAERCGLHALIGRADGPAQVCPVPLAAAADGALAALRSLLSGDALDGWRGAALLTERATVTGLSRHGATAPGGSCRLLPAADGHLAVNLARDADWAMVPAWLETEATDIAAVAAAVATKPVATLVERADWLGLAVAADAVDGSDRPWYRVSTGRRFGDAATGCDRAPRVVDLSSLWAGPLCGRLLRQCGADVVKVESLQRPDGARRGHSGFYDRLNGGKRSVVLDLSSMVGRSRLHALLAAADIVIESTRPRALRQFGIDAAQLLDARPGLTWISVTGYGRDAASEHRVAYGDDAGVAAGLSSLQRAACGETLIVGDAIADPLTGIHAALAAWASWRDGGGRLVSLALRDVVRGIIGFDLLETQDAFKARRDRWAAVIANAPDLAPVTVPADDIAAAVLGADTDAVFADWHVAC